MFLNKIYIIIFQNWDFKPKTYLKENIQVRDTSFFSPVYIQSKCDFKRKSYVKGRIQSCALKRKSYVKGRI